MNYELSLVDEIDDAGDVADVYLTVFVHVGSSSVEGVRLRTVDLVDDGGDVVDVHGAVTIGVARLDG